jgi:SAM-dependent methyltransferase
MTENEGFTAGRAYTRENDRFYGIHLGALRLKVYQVIQFAFKRIGSTPLMEPILSRKEKAELAFWESRVQQQGVLSNDHFEYFYTTHFGLDKAFYRDKKILDIGCGPRGSLEWATQARVRVGLDPLAQAYRRLGTDRHSMQYVTSGAEHIPFPTAFFDIVCSLNSLDHVDDLDQVITEIIRVVASEGLFLLLTDIHRHPTVLEPAAYSWNIVERFLPALEIVEQSHFEYSVLSAEGFGDIYQSLRQGVPYNHADPTERYGILSVRFRKRD